MVTLVIMWFNWPKVQSGTSCPAWHCFRSWKYKHARNVNLECNKTFLKNFLPSLGYSIFHLIYLMILKISAFSSLLQKVFAIIFFWWSEIKEDFLQDSKVVVVVVFIVVVLVVVFVVVVVIIVVIVLLVFL